MKNYYNSPEAASGLKSQATWVEAGDNNTKLFHSFATMQRTTNGIWNICDEGDQILTSQQDIQHETYSHFKALFLERELSFRDQMDHIKLIPLMIHAEYNEPLYKPTMTT